MTTIRDNLIKSEDKFNTVSNIMEKKRKLYLLKRDKSADVIINDSNICTDASSFSAWQQEIVCTKTNGYTNSLKSLISSNKKSKMKSSKKCSFRRFCKPAFNIGRTNNYKSKPELCICNENIRLSESDDCNTSPSKVDNNNCSCNKNCHSSCRLTNHHKNVLDNKSAQNSSANQQFHLSSSNNQEKIYLQNSYYFLRNLQEFNLAQTDTNTIETTCASTKTLSSTLHMVTTMATSVHPETKLRTYSSHRKEYSPPLDIPYNKQSSTKKKIILQFCNITMILKLLLVYISRTQPLISFGGLAPLELQKTDRQGNYQNSSIHVKQRLRNFADQQYSHNNKQKSSLSTRNVSFAKMILLSLSFLSIFLPFSQSLSFETTLQSSLAALERAPRDVVVPDKLRTNHSLPSEKVRLSRPEHVCKSLDIRNTAEQFQQVENCTVIEGFLLITLLNGNSLEDYNGTFPLLTEITEYLVVYQVHYLRSIGRIFPNLSVIRGTDLFEGYALVVYSNSHLEELGLTKLTTISRGGVRIEKNVMLCFVKSIDWSEIVSNTTDIVIKDNRGTIECPACPGDFTADQNELSCKERHGQRHCWNSKTCQKFCPKECRNNCLDENTCCNEACLGGCSPNNLNECINCRHFSIYNTTCIDKCPDNYYKYLDRRCLTAESCGIIGRKFENNRQEVLVAHEGSCTTACPEGYTKENMTCVKCGDKCIKKCEGGIIDSVARAKDLHRCTHIVQSPLIINIKRGGRHLMEDLSFGLSSIISIESSLKVQGTYGIFNLKFFKNLQRIEGQSLIEQKYAFYVIENFDIETIWNQNQTVQILRGGVYFHFNFKLCLSEINSLLPMLNKTKFDLEDVSDSNGSRGKCNTVLLNVTVFNVGSLTAFAKIDNPMIYEDERTFIGYQFLHIEDPFGNATKHAFRPCEDKWEISDPNKETFYLFQGLKPYTRYSFYVQTLTISTERRNAQSEIHHFKTKSDKPQNVNKLQSYSNSSSSIVLSWLPPLKANGKLIKYKIRALYDKRIQRIESRNYCKDPVKESSKTEIPLPAKTEKPVLPKNCNCKKTNALTYDDEDIDASIHESIELENSLQNFVYVKKERRRTKTANTNELLDQNSNRNRRAIEGDNLDSFLLRHIRDAPVKENLAHDIMTTSSTTTVSSVDSHQDGILFFNETRMDPEGEYYEVFVDSVNASTTEYVFTKLKHFSLYMLGVEACREKDSENDTTDCSNEVTTYVRTLKLENVDRVEELRAVRETTNSSRSNIRLFWERPSRPNGAVVSYNIFYLLKSQDAVEEKKCITESDYVELGYQQYGYVLTNLNAGNYTIRISTNTLAGEGQSSKLIYVDIAPATLPLSVIIGIAVGAVLTVVLIGVLTYFCRKRILAPPSDLKIFPSVNPHYVSLQYIPDEWEVARENVIQLNPLGQGSFGMVYEGILKGYKQNEDTPCAIKTVNENATDRERMNFLNEACVMKQFDTYHVVRLMGVCSHGQPALVVMELMKKGDLKSYLREHRPDERDELGMPRSVPVALLPPTMKRIYQMAIEIADGMAYLAAKKFVHRDLAARNCMVAADLTVKIGDFGMTRDIYENDYYRKGTKGLLPVRWMPPESLRDGIYSTSSDVFSYGVVLWEMATLASQPYQGLSNDQVLRYVIDGGVMERPENCPDKLYNLMQKCWQHRPSARPTFMEIIRYLLNFADPHFREVSFYHSEKGQQILVKEIAERNEHSGDVFEDCDNDMEDVTTPLRLEEYSGGYKLNLDNNSSVEQRGDSSMIIDDDAPHSQYSLTGSPLMVSSTPDEHIRNNYNMSRIINSHNQILNSAPSTSAELRKTSSGISSYPHPHTHPHHKNLYQPTRYAQQQTRYNRSDDVDAYVPPDFELKDLMDIKRTSAEQGYEMYDPSPNYSGKVTVNAHDDEEDDINTHSNAGQNLLSRSKSRQKPPTIMSLSSSMPDDVIGQPQSSALHPSTASAASSNASSKAGKYHGLKAAADFGNNMTAKFRNILFNTHKRSGSNASYRSTSSKGGAGISNSSNNNLTRVGRGKSMSGQNLGTIESGGSGSTESYCPNPQANTPKNVISTSENPIYKRLNDGSGNAVSNKSKLPTSSVFSMSSNPNYQVLDESLNTTGASTSASNAAANSPLLKTSENPSYQLMQAPAIQKPLNASSYVMMNEPKAPTTSAISTSSNSNYQMMGPQPPPSATTGPTSTSVLPQPSVARSRTEAGTETATREHSKKNSSSSSALFSSCQETDDDDGITARRGMKSDRIPLSRSSSKDRSKKKKHSNNRSRSQSSSSSSRSSNATTKTSQLQHQQSSANPKSLIASSTLLTKENWLKQQPTQTHHNRSQPPPPNGFVGRETS